MGSAFFSLHRRPAARRVMLVLPLLIAACRDPAVAPGIPASIVIHGGDMQLATIGAQLAAPLSVLVTDETGRAVRGVAVHWSATDGGSVSPKTSLTDGAGVAQAFRAVGSPAGKYYTTASFEGLPGGSVKFTTIVQVQGATEILRNPVGHGHNQIAAAGTELAPYRVLVRDYEGKPVRGVRVEWNVSVGGGQISAYVSETDAAGIAQTTHTLGPMAGPGRVEASVSGLVGSPVGFESTSHVQGAITIGALLGQITQDTDTVLTRLAPFKVVVRGVNAAPVSGVIVRWELEDGAAGTLSDQTTITDSDGIAQATLTFGTAATIYRVHAAVNGLVGSPITFQRTAQAGRPVTLVKASGDEQIGLVNTTLSSSYTVLASDAYGNVASPGQLTWSVTSGGGTLFVNANGTARHTLGPDDGTQTVTVTATLGGSTSFSSTAVSAIGLVDVTGHAFTPPEIVVQPGKTVAWRWTPCSDWYYWYYYDTCESHNIVFEDGVSSPLQTSGTYRRTFGQAVTTVRYRCTRHSTDFDTGMVGRVRVTP